MARIDQVIPSLASRDAIGVHTLALSEGLRARGIDSTIYYGNATPDVAALGQPITDLARAGKRHLLYQSSIGSPVFDHFAARPEPKLVNYHNITPARLLAPWEPAVGFEVSLGRTQLARLADVSGLAVADSYYNEGELHDLGFRTTAVVSLLIDMKANGVLPDPAMSEALRARKAKGGIDLLFVGKVSPHKAPHDLVKALSLYRRLYDPMARLNLVGSPLGSRYLPSLQGFIDELGLSDAVFIVGSLSQEELESYWRNADVFVCASDHEGFCVPLVEAMGHGIPVVANAVAAIPETVGEAGVLVRNKTPLSLAASIHRVVTDKTLRSRLIAAGHARAGSFDHVSSREKFVDLLVDAIN